MKNVRTVFFDLDHTLWDFEKNSTEALHELIDIHQLRHVLKDGAEEFIRKYKVINHHYWEAYRKGEIEKSVLRVGRFRHALEEQGVMDPSIHEAFSEGYVEISPAKTNLFPHAVEVLEYLNEKYPMLIITNGFEEIQWKKLRNCGIDHFFKHVITSEMAGVKKPHADIYRYALGLANTIAPHAVMIGDEPEIDLRGADDLGMPGILFDPNHKHPQSGFPIRIHDLLELKQWL